YLDTVTADMERVFLANTPEGVTLCFNAPRGAGTQRGTIAQANYFFVTNYQVTREVIAAAPHLRMIQRTGVGYDNVDVAYAQSLSLPVSISLGTNMTSVAELVIAHILTLYRNLQYLNPMAKEGIWDSWKYRHESYEIYGKTVGVVGCGAIGRTVIRRLASFEPERILYYDVERQPATVEQQLGITYCSLDDLIARADIITLHVPLFATTTGLISRERIARMKPNAILINTARGPVVDQPALVEAVRDGRIAGAGLDTFDPEPFVKDSEVLQHGNIITTPHIGAATVDNFVRVIRFCLENVLRCERGEKPLHVVNGVEYARK
ncbi:MAG: 2-hydroxyacid dehydrogenase, partial [Planctomycetes bacterium]|nr:2-hydroxyacid dehydrogenase [Planctomycetota bacterium]